MNAPRRRIQATLEIEADTWADMGEALQELGRKLQRSPTVSTEVGGYSYGWIWKANVDEHITPQSWRRDLDSYLQNQDLEY